MAILSSFTILFTALFCWIRKPKGGFISLLLKALATLMLLFMTVKILNIAPDLHIGLPALFLLAMGFSLAGDIFIDLKATIPSKSSSFLLLGFLAFLAAQVFFITTFIALSELYYMLFFYAAIVSAILHFVFVRFLKYEMQGFTFISFVYVAALISAIFQSGVVAYSSDWQLAETGFFVAALVFALSDAILSQTLFANKNTKLYIIGTHIFYYAGQLLYVWSLYYYILQQQA